MEYSLTNALVAKAVFSIIFLKNKESTTPLIQKENAAIPFPFGLGIHLVLLCYEEYLKFLADGLIAEYIISCHPNGHIGLNLPF